jgi:surface antigen
MRMKIIKTALAGLLALSLAGCANGGPSNEQIGGLVGAAAGVAIGSQIGSGTGRTLAIAAGALLGYWAGSAVARRLTTEDRAYMSSTQNAALKSNGDGQTSSWRNPQSGNSGSITPTTTYKTAQGTTCRTFSESISAGGQSDSASGTACQQPDGSWRVN